MPSSMEIPMNKNKPVHQQLAMFDTAYPGTTTSPQS